jgi:hypothetical protein
MSSQFQRVISELWANLNLGKPKFEDSPTIILTVESLSVTLEESEDERQINVSAHAGSLSPDPIARSMQIRTILDANLGNLTTMAAGVSIDEEGRPDADVYVRAVYAYSAGRMSALMSILQDVLTLAQAHSVRLRGSGTGQAKHRSSRAERIMAREEDVSVIFRP